MAVTVTRTFWLLEVTDNAGARTVRVEKSRTVTVPHRVIAGTQARPRLYIDDTPVLFTDDTPTYYRAA